MLGTIISIIKPFISLAVKILSYKGRKQLEEKGRLEEQKKALQEAKDALDKANRARCRARSELNDGGVPSDYEHYRD